MMTKENNNIEKKALALFEQALDQPHKARAKYVEKAAAGDEDLKSRALKLLKLDSLNAAKIMTGHAVFDGDEQDLSNVNVGSYRITELIGKGGMGAVYKAERRTGDFTHDVAIKLIRPGVLSEPLVERFARERQTLADFSHPHIARLFDGGTTDDGTPYIIMEFVDGASITEWVDIENKSTAERLTLFKHVCEAIRYAHQNLIIHRDITPNNVLVTKDGSVKLIDFGIAKSVESQDVHPPVENSLGSLSFTPGFAAPERSKGAPANTLSDVYSLGQLLNVLIDPTVQTDDLKAIVQKAAAIDPTARYTSVDALIDELDKYKAGFPVDAHAQNAAYKFTKFINRHKVGALASTLAIFGLITAVAVTSFQYQRAETARVDADKRFNDVRNLANTMMFEIYDEMDFVPGAIKAKTSLAEAAQTYLDDLSSAPSAQDNLKIEAAKGYIRLGSILGSVRMSSAGKYDQAKLNISNAEMLLNDIDPLTTDNITALSTFYDLSFFKATNSLYVDARPNGALPLFNQALDFATRASALEPDQLDYKLDILTVKMEIAIAARWDNRLDEALENISNIIDEYESLLKTHPDTPILLEGFGKALRTKAEFFSSPDKAIQALPLATRAIDIEKQRVSNGNDASLKDLRALAFSYWRRATPNGMLKRHEDAVSDYEKAIEHIETIVARDPGNLDAQSLLAGYQGEVATSLVNLKRYSEAEKYITHSKTYFQNLFDDNPDLGRHQRSMMVMHVQLYSFYKAWNKEVKRCENQRLIEFYRDLMAEHSNLSENDRVGVEQFIAREPICP